MITVGLCNVTGDNSGRTGNHWNGIVGHCDRVVRYYGGRVLILRRPGTMLMGAVYFNSGVLQRENEALWGNNVAL